MKPLTFQTTEGRFDTWPQSAWTGLTALPGLYLIFIVGKCHGAACVLQLTHTVVAQAAVGGARGPEHLAGEAVLELDHLLVDQDLLSARRRPVAGVSSVVCGEGTEKSTSALIRFTVRLI